MDLGRIEALKEAFRQDRDGLVFTTDIVDIEAAFKELVDSGAALRDDPDNATAEDMLEELREHASRIEEVIYQWVLENFGGAEAANPSWSTHKLAEAINSMPVLIGAKDTKLGFLIGDLTGKQPNNK